MERKLDLNIHGLELVVTVEYEDNSVYGVTEVCAKMKNNLPIVLKCDTVSFFDELEDYLQGELQEALQADFERNNDIRYDAMKEELYKPGED